MKRHTAHDAGGHGEPWLITYADMVTLLMALFIVLLSVSTIDQQKAEEITEAMKKSVSQTKSKMTFQEIKKKVDAAVKENKVENQVKTTLTPRGVDIEFSSNVFFDSGSAELKTEALMLMGSTATILRELKYDDLKINVEGHTDSSPIKTALFPSNWELSTARSGRVLRFFIEKGVSEKRLEATGLAATHPKEGADGNVIAASDPSNRRVVIRVLRDPYWGFTKGKAPKAAGTGTATESGATPPDHGGH